MIVNDSETPGKVDEIRLMMMNAMKMINDKSHMQINVLAPVLVSIRKTSQIQAR